MGDCSKKKKKNETHERYKSIMMPTRYSSPRVDSTSWVVTCLSRYDNNGRLVLNSPFVVKAPTDDDASAAFLRLFLFFEVT